LHPSPPTAKWLAEFVFSIPILLRVYFKYDWGLYLKSNSLSPWQDKGMVKGKKIE
jgi:hypothetical protein